MYKLMISMTMRQNSRPRRPPLVIFGHKPTRWGIAVLTHGPYPYGLLHTKYSSFGILMIQCGPECGYLSYHGISCAPCSDKAMVCFSNNKTHAVLCRLWWSVVHQSSEKAGESHLGSRNVQTISFVHLSMTVFPPVELQA